MQETTDYKKSVIMGLIRGHKDLKKYDDNVIKRNTLIHNNFNVRYNYPLVIFHEGNIDEGQQKYIIEKSEGGKNIKFVNISADWTMDMTGGMKDPWKNCAGFNKMCRFYSFPVYKYLQEYDYAMRLDDDSFIETEIKYDIFEDMHKNNLDYGYVRRKKDIHKPTIKTFVPFCKKYFNKELYPVQNFYNNFHVSRINFWNNPEIKVFFDAVEETGNIKNQRWGDSNIQAVCVKNWSSKEKIKAYTDFVYMHGSGPYTNREKPQHEWNW
tara:strand:+ start:211 stop:1011 length:801 start_codon:yes stop_codon:yes gene_type:complete